MVCGKPSVRVREKKENTFCGESSVRVRAKKRKHPLW